MAIREHPTIGTVVTCNFQSGFVAPEMVGRRPVVVISPKMKGRPGLCTIVALSTTPPDPVRQYHCQIDIRPRLPDPWRSEGVWVKGDMINAVGFHRLDLIRLGKDPYGKRRYLYEPLSDYNLERLPTDMNRLGIPIRPRD
ncbi:type II toxin-antitoxin system PemK/MazF family toxin [Psychromarinibacter sp. C21-152]|uniref:Type II toxin-antitoxin system PemK/MazF family toxin n=1 Tax=Psychromarinibacter sediminicola TaxID=3033385 RepID=A0AAE3TC61_9RHOB|nr:type II toxin-antitoxin system PemK/MazF family toxin [Psychromarinibacter sediminicola]MDF0603325.1 type II toxin-antitoxin system PemK/MazF family toxin [Psychromarinibacter sediminicola]